MASLTIFDDFSRICINAKITIPAPKKMVASGYRCKQDKTIKLIIKNGLHSFPPV